MVKIVSQAKGNSISLHDPYQWVVAGDIDFNYFLLECKKYDSWIIKYYSSDGIECSFDTKKVLPGIGLSTMQQATYFE